MRELRSEALDPCAAAGVGSARSPRGFRPNPWSWTNWRLRGRRLRVEDAPCSRTAVKTLHASASCGASSRRNPAARSLLSISTRESSFDGVASPFEVDALRVGKDPCESDPSRSEPVESDRRRTELGVGSESRTLENLSLSRLPICGVRDAHGRRRGSGLASAAATLR